MSERKYKALYGCRNDICSDEVSWPEFDLMEHPDGGPICDSCWEQEMYKYCAEDSEPPKLKKWVSPETEDRAQLQEKVRVLREAAQLALESAESWIHDQLDGTGSLQSALAELQPVRNTLQATAPEQEGE